MFSQQTIDILLKAANRIDARDWRVVDDSGRLHSGWLVGATSHVAGVSDGGYSARTAFADWWRPGEYRADGLRTNATAAEHGRKIGADATAAAIRECVRNACEALANTQGEI